jgi:hypothetical protein
VPERVVNAKETSVVLEDWRRVKRLHGLTDAQVQMGRELEMNPRQLPHSAPVEQGQTKPSLAQLIEDLYRRRFKKPLPDSVVPLRQALHEARAKERTEARDRRRRKRQAEIDHAKAARITLITLRRLIPGGLYYDDIMTDDPTSESRWPQ